MLRYLLFFMVMFSTNVAKATEKSEFVLIRFNLKDSGRLYIIPFGEKYYSKEECWEAIKKTTFTEFDESCSEQGPLGNYTHLLGYYNDFKLYSFFCFPKNKWDKIEAYEFSEQELKKNKIDDLSLYKKQEKIMDMMVDCGLPKYDFSNIPVIHDNPFICEKYNKKNKIKTINVFDIFAAQEKNKKYVKLEAFYSKPLVGIGIRDTMDKRESKLLGSVYTKQECVDSVKKDMEKCIEEGSKVIGKATCKTKGHGIPYYYTRYGCVSRDVIFGNIASTTVEFENYELNRVFFLNKKKIKELYKDFPIELEEEEQIEKYDFFPFND